jgi:hypothetical protein
MMGLPVIKRVSGAAPPPAAKPAVGSAKVKQSNAALAAAMTLPTGPCPVSTDIQDYTFLIYAPGGWGKTRLVTTFPDLCYFGTERGFKGIEGVYSIAPAETNYTITSWEMMRRGVELLEGSDRFANVAVDTADNAYEMCMRWVCGKQGGRHPDDIQDRGKTWNDIKHEFLDVLNRISATGRGLYITSHVRDDKVERASGKDYTRIGPSLVPSAAKALIAFVDFCFYGDYVGMSGTGVQRVMFTQGDELIVGKNRKRGSGLPLPEVIALPDQAHEEQDYEYLKAMFEGRLEGFNLAAALESGRTSKAVRTKILQSSAAAAAASLQGKEAPGT